MGIFFKHTPKNQQVNPDGVKSKLAPNKLSCLTESEEKIIRRYIP